VLAGAFILLYVGVALARLRHPFELEWMEGAMLDHVDRILLGQPLYVPPSLEFTPFIYPPLYWFVAALASIPLGPGFLALRAVSLSASLLNFALIGAIVMRETGSARLALLSAGCFAATFEASGRWFDIGRSDSLFLALVLAGIHLSRSGTSAGARLVAGIVFGLAVLTKQNALLIAAPVAAYVAVTDRLRGLLLGAGLIVTLLVSSLALDRLYDGLFSYYAFVAPASMAQRLVSERWVLFWTRDIAGHLAVASGVAAFFLFQVLASRRKGGMFFVVLALGMSASAWLPRMQSGGIENTLIPTYALIAILFGLGLHSATSSLRGAQPGVRRPVELLIWTLCAVQFVSLAYNPAAAVPTAADRLAGESLVQRLAETEGPVLVYSHGHLASRAGKPATAHAMAFGDALLAARPAGRQQLERHALETIARKHYAAVVLDGQDALLWPALTRDYACESLAFAGPKVFLPVSGWRVRPEYFCVPKP